MNIKTSDCKRAKEYLEERKKRNRTKDNSTYAKSRREKDTRERE
jgi:hypothetical protein